MGKLSLPEKPEEEREKQAYKDAGEEREMESEVSSGVMDVPR